VGSPLTSLQMAQGCPGSTVRLTNTGRLSRLTYPLVSRPDGTDGDGPVTFPPPPPAGAFRDRAVLQHGSPASPPPARATPSPRPPCPPAPCSRGKTAPAHAGDGAEVP